MKPLPMKRTLNANQQNEINRSIVFNYLRETGAKYRAEIAKDLKLSAPAVSRSIEALVEEGYLVDLPSEAATRGRRARRVSVNAKKGCVVGIDLMREPVRTALFDFGCNVIGDYDAFPSADTEDVQNALVNAVRRCVSQHRVSKRLEAICLGVPAIVDGTGAVKSAILYEHLVGKNLKQPLEDAFHVPVLVENAANLSAMAEVRYGAAKGLRDVVYLEVSNGVGAGVVLNRALYRGAHGSAGEIGFSQVGDSDKSHVNSNVGSVDRTASTASIRMKALQVADRNPRWSLLKTIGGTGTKLTASAVCRGALEGDGECLAIIAECRAALAAVVVNTAALLDPEMVVIGGEITRLPGAERLFGAPIRRHLIESIPFETPDVVLSTLGDRAVVVGASHMAVESLLTGRYPYWIEQ